jgi:hypothetical protein
MQYGMVFDEKREGDLTHEQDGVSLVRGCFQRTIPAWSR